jgi:glutamine amidotransferase-like uncharacterized protein
VLTASRPLALVYRGPASLPGCPEAVAGLLAASRWPFDVRYVGPREPLRLSADTLARAAVYAQPGGGGLGRAYRRLRRHREVIRGYVRAGGRYLGFCLGAYLAGATPGFALLPGDTDRYVGSSGCTVNTTGDAVVEVHWRGRVRRLYFQDGPYLIVAGPADVLATYPNGAVAALVAPFGAGRVGVVGPHPEATTDWYADAGLPVGPPGLDLGLDLVDMVMAP